MSEERYEKALSLVTGVLDYERFKDVDLVIEASHYPYSWTKIVIARFGQPIYPYSVQPIYPNSGFYHNCRRLLRM